MFADFLRGRMAEPFGDVLNCEHTNVAGSIEELGCDPLFVVSSASYKAYD